MNVQTFSRRDTSILGRWWWTIDRWNLGAVLLLVAVGILLSFAASPAVADRLRLGGFYFVKRHIMMVPMALLAMLFMSMLSPRNIRRAAVLLFFVSVILLILTLFIGVEVKGARRWVSFAGFSVQASEFVKPAFAVIIAWMLSEAHKTPQFPGLSVAFAFLCGVLGLLLLQPDLGMSVVITLTWICQVFVAGLPIIWLVMLAVLAFVGLVGAYVFLPHVARRIDQFLNPSSLDPRHDLYQIQQSLDAFGQGGFLGRGPGEGLVKRHVPDAHADFVFAVAGEEFGLVLCLLIVFIFSFFVMRALTKSLMNTNLFAMLAVVGLVAQFGLQALINMASSLHLIPTKGMTMPFISYGGSSMVALGIAVGMILAFTRKNHGTVLQSSLHQEERVG